MKQQPKTIAQRIAQQDTTVAVKHLVELLRIRAQEQPHDIAYRFLSDGETEGEQLSFGELDQRARAIAARLQTMSMSGQRALLLYPPGLPYIEAFFGCLYAGVVAVPAYPPSRHHLNRLQGIVEDAAPAIVMTTDELQEKLLARFSERWGTGHFQWLVTDTVDRAGADGWLSPNIAPGDLAFLQYTSGSTGHPKGVMVSHQNLLANQHAIKESFHHTEKAIVVGWLPLYHDMGLIGNILQPLYLGTKAILMSPLTFMDQPVRWLQAISRYRATTSGGPNFAYELCLRKITAEQKRDLDLSTWTVAFNGAEPVRATTIERFSAAFAECGFRREAFFPCYGLAEATLFVTGPAAGSPLKFRPAITPAEEGAESIAALAAEQSKPLVGCGQAWIEHEVKIVDPVSGQACPEGHVGEIWVAGPCIAQGYWNQPEESEHTFRATISMSRDVLPLGGKDIYSSCSDRHSGESRNPDAETSAEVSQGMPSLALDSVQSMCGMTTCVNTYTLEGRAPAKAAGRGEGEIAPGDAVQTFLRTGDLGFSHQGELFVTGRIKDLIILRGRNYYPQDLEEALDEHVEALRPGCNAAFSVILENEEHLVIVAEVRRPSLTEEEARPIFNAMRQALANACDAPIHAMVLVPPGAVPKTSSGKVRRRACKEAYLGNGLKILAHSDEQTAAPIASPADFTSSLLRDAFKALPSEQRVPFIERFLTTKIAQLLKIPETSLTPTQPLWSLGLSSLQAVELKHTAETLLGIEAPVTLFLSDHTLVQVAELLGSNETGGWRLEAGEKRPQGSSLQPPVSGPLSYAQQAMWTVHQMEPGSVAYNLHLALRIHGSVDHALLQRALEIILERHEQLRNVYRADGDTVYRTAVPLATLSDYFSAIDATGGDESQLQQALSRQAHEPFDLAQGPLLHVYLYKQAGDMNTLLFCAHHITVDLWSLLIILRELGTAYESLAKGHTLNMATPSFLSHLSRERLSGGYSDFVIWQDTYLNRPTGEAAWNYWRTQLAGDLPILSLPTDYARLQRPNYRGASYALRIEAELTEKLKALGRNHGATLFMVLLAAYKVLLHRYTQQNDVIVGTTSSGRSQARFAEVVGNFVNPLALRTYPKPNQSFSAYLEEVRNTVREALAHQDFPFPGLVDRLQPERTADHWPIYQTWFVLQQAQSEAEREFAQLALGEDGESLPWGGWSIQPLALQERVENFDLKVMAAECENGLLSSFQYRSDLFKANTIRRLAGHFQKLLEGIVANPETRLGELALLTESEQRQTLIDWNATSAAYPQNKCLYQLFEEQAERTPGALAVVFEDQSLSYSELNAKANQLAYFLRYQGVGPETLVGLCVEGSLEMIVGILGILKAGGAYVPIDPNYPKERIAYLIEDSQAALLLTQKHLLTGLPEPVIDTVCLDRDWGKIIEHSTDNPAVLSMPENAAYVIYTSGSTGKPKGVLVSHRNAVHSTHARLSYYKEPVGSFLLLSSFAFDSSVAGIFWALSQGGKLCIPHHDTHTNPVVLAERIAQEHVTHLLALPTLYNLLLGQAAGGQFDLLQAAIVAGEACPPTLVARHYSKLPHVQLFNEYGPTEGTVWSSVYQLQPEDTGASASIGRSITNVQIYLLDAYLNPVPVSLPGELYIGGAGLARGYMNRPELTAERFIPDLFGETGSHLYKTGDLARYRPDGNIEFLGRVDHQVKIRGFRIELSEIESRLLQHPQVKEAVVIAREDSPSDKRLVAYIVGTEQEVLEVESLRVFLKETLPDYMVPSAFVVLDQLPLTPNGKLDRKALPLPDVTQQFSHQYVAPRNPTEERLAKIWAEVLRIERVGIHDNFFSLGGDSILAIQMASRGHQAGLAVTPRHVFQHQTVADLTSVTERIVKIEQALELKTVSGPFPAISRLTPEHFPLARLEQDELDALPYDPLNTEDIYPLTPMQEGMLFHTLMQPHSGIYLMQDRFDICGNVDVNVFQQAWEQVVKRHPILRTSFIWETRTVPHQIVHKRVSLLFEYFDWRDLSDAERQVRLDEILQAELEAGFDLSHAPLLRIRLIRLGEDRYRFLRSHHHILLDAWCISLILTEFKAKYDALVQKRNLTEQTIPRFRDYIAWLQSRDLAVEEDFWRNYLRGFTEPTPLVVDHLPLKDKQQNLAIGDVVTFLSEEETNTLNVLAKRYLLTPNTFVQAAAGLLLSRYSGRGEVLFGVTVAGRPPDLPNVEVILGLFTNSLPLRLKVRPDQSVLGFLRDLLQQNLEIRQYEYTSLTQIQAWSELTRGQDLFQHLLTFENAPVDPSLREKAGLFHFTDVEVRTHTNYPITVMVIPGTELHLQITYQCQRFETKTIERMLGHFKRLLLGMIHDPQARVGELLMLTGIERYQLLHEWNQTTHLYPEPWEIIPRFEAQVEHTSEAVAVACDGGQLTYRELNSRANRVAHALMAYGIGPDVIVALLDDRGVDFLVMMLGIFKADGAYLPLDPSHPDARLVQVLQESQVGLVLTGASYRERAQSITQSVLPASPVVITLAELEGNSEELQNPLHRHAPQNLAFVIFTSGSTGTPKGAMVEHRGMFNNLITKVPTLGLTEADVIAQTAGQCFDISVWQHLTALVCGARVGIFSDEVVRDPSQLLRQLADHGVTILEAVPSMVQALLEMSGTLELPKLRWLLACGEAFPPELCRRWMERFPHVKVLNAYGPAECSDDVSYYPIEGKPSDSDLVVPVGRPVDNTRLYIPDRWLQPVPIGVPGEICVAGIQVGRGYLNRPDLTAAAFIPDPFCESGERLYRTGDLGRYREDGAIEFLGRIDHQLKIRGFRIEPGEIEAKLLQHPQVKEAVVLAREDRQRDKRLLAYVVGQQSNAEENSLVEKLRSYLGAVLPSYMVPAAFVVLEAMPLSANGKIDRKALPQPDIAGQLENQYVAPRKPTEEILVGIWKEVLGMERVGVRDNFFALGGHSLLAVQVLSRVRAAFGIEVPFRRLFESSTIAELAVLIEDILIEELETLSDEEAQALLAAES